jgi:flagellar hook-basal body complex protein FliE
MPITSISPIVPTIAAPAAPTAAQSGGGSSFASALSDSLGNVGQAQAQANQQVQALAAGQSQDMSSVVMSVEKASLELQLATQVRNKAVDAYNEIFRMQV